MTPAQLCGQLTRHCPYCPLTWSPPPPACPQSAGLIDLEAISAMPDSKPRMLQSMGYRYEIRAMGIAAADLRVVAAR